MVEDASYWIMPVYINKNWEYEFLVINQKTYNWNFWWFPKWHAEAWEDGITAAKRELSEEVWIEKIDIDLANFWWFKYNFKENWLEYNKTVKYRLWFVISKDIKIEEEELNWYKRANYETTLKVLSYKNMKEVFIKATKDLFVIN
jgi:hypothetical protein